MEFNRFTEYAKFTNIFYGGFDGLNILNEKQYYMTDQGSSNTSGGGYAASDYTDTGLGTQPNGTSNPAGTNLDNSLIMAYRTSARMLADFHISDANILTIPGIRSPLVVDYAGNQSKDNGQQF